MRVGTPSFDLSALFGLFGPRRDAPVAPQREPVRPVERQFHFKDGFDARGPRLQDLLLGADFKQARQEALEGTSPRARQAQGVEQSFRRNWGDGFEAARSPMVDLGRPARAAQAPEQPARSQARPANDFMPSLADLG